MVYERGTSCSREHERCAIGARACNASTMQEQWTVPCVARRMQLDARENECGAMLIYMNNGTRRYCTTRTGLRLFFHRVSLQRRNRLLSLDIGIRYLITL